MGWDSPAVRWRELQRQMTGGAGGERAPGRIRPAGPGKPAPRPVPADGLPWAELHCHSSFSFLDGAATPDELVAEAARLGLETLALTDHDGMYGIPQFAQAAARLAARGGRLRTVFGAELSLGLPPGPDKKPDPPGRHLLGLARDPAGHRRVGAASSGPPAAGREEGRPLHHTRAL